MAGSAGKTAPSSVAEGLGDVLRALTSAMTAPDATAHAKTLMDLQARVLTQLHKLTAPAGQPGQPPQGGPPGAPPGGPQGPQPGQMGGAPGGMNLAGLQGQPQGPSSAAQSSISPDMLRQLAAAGAST